jgi:hypothetical protein
VWPAEPQSASVIHRPIVTVPGHPDGALEPIRNSADSIIDPVPTLEDQLAGKTTLEGALMHYGSGQLIRQTLMLAKPWQRYLIGVVMIVGGVALVLIGHIAGGLLAVAGVLLLWRMVRHWLRRSSSISGTADQRPGSL